VAIVVVGIDGVVDDPVVCGVGEVIWSKKVVEDEVVWAVWVVVDVGVVCADSEVVCAKTENCATPCAVLNPGLLAVAYAVYCP
jgi:hypothetical protein